MKLKRKANGKIVMSQEEWQKIGRQAGWGKKAQMNPSEVEPQTVVLPPTPNSNLFTAYPTLDLTSETQHIICEQTSREIAVQFSIDIEWREWGIKAIEVVPQGVIDIEFKVIPYDEETEEYITSVRVDVGKVKNDIDAEAGVCTIENIAIHLDEHLNVVYDECYMDIIK